MQEHASKSSDNNSKAIANNLQKLQSFNESASQLDNTYPETIAQGEMQKMADNSLQVKQLRAYQAIANNYLSQTTQRKENLQRRTFATNVVQRNYDEKE